MIFSRLNGLSRAAAKQRTTELLTEFSLTASADKALSAFSGGMRRRLDLAVSLITRPALLFLDEPTTSLDPRTRSQMWTTIRQLVAHGSTIVLTTQYLDEADALADRVAVIDHGQLIQLGTPTALKQQIGGATLKLALNKPTQGPIAQDLLAQALHTQPTLRDGQLMAHLEDPNQITDLLVRLQAADISLANIAVQEPSLDDVFFALTTGKN